MKNVKYYLSCLILIQLSHTKILSQDVVFSGFEYTNGMINPALTADNHDLQITAGTRSQWKKFGGSYNTMVASGEFAINKKANHGYLASGFDLYTDNSGSGNLVTNSIKGNLAYHLPLSIYDKLTVGMYLGYLGFNSNVEKDRWGSQYDGNDYNSGLTSGESFNGSQKSTLDAGVGVVYSSKFESYLKTPTFQIGLSAFHLNRPNISIINDQQNKLPIRYSFFINTCYFINDSKYTVKPSLNMQFQNNFFYMIVGSMVSLDLTKKARFSNKTQLSENISAGLFYRSSGAIVGRLSYQKSSWNIGISHDINFGSRSGIGSMRSATEINLRYFLR